MARRARGDGSVYYDAARGCWVGSVDIGRNPQTGTADPAEGQRADQDGVPGQAR